MAARSMADIRRLFAEEAEQRLSRLGQLVLDLESRPGDEAELVGEIFREVHTLKGSAAVVGLEAVGRYAHEVEGRLEQLRSGAAAINAVVIDALLVAIDHLSAMIHGPAAGTDTEAHADGEGARAAIARLDSAFDTPTAVATPVVEPRPRPVVPVSRQTGEREAGGSVVVPVERLDALTRLVGEASTGLLRVGRVLTDRVGVEPGDIAEFGELGRVLNDLQERATGTLMVPIATIAERLQRVVRDAARSLGKDVRWELRGESTELDRGVLHQLGDALLHLLRNAIDHGIESPQERASAGKPAQAVVRLHAMQLGSEVTVAITDDGRGIDIGQVRERALRMGIDATDMDDDAALQLIFRSGLSTSSFVSDISGRGVGLDVVRASVEAARGRVDVRTTAGVGSEFRLVVPITLAVLDCLLVETAGQRFALALHRIALVRSSDPAAELAVEGRRATLVDGSPVLITDLAEVLDLPAPAGPGGTLVVVNGTAGRHAFRVDALVGHRDVAVKAVSPLVDRLDLITGTSIEPDGSILLVLDAVALIERARRRGGRNAAAAGGDVASSAAQHRGSVLVVDDALTVRELQRAILERAGYAVRVAGDGVEALELQAVEAADVVLTDVEMPRMGGFELTEQIRCRPELANLAILVLTSLANDVDRQRGMDAGADGYLVKSAFDEHTLLAAVERMIGTPS